MICAIHQPQFIPWLGYLHKMAGVDRFVFLDTVQFKKNEFQNRNKVLVQGEPRWLTVPVSFDFGASLAQVRIAELAGWQRKLLMTVRHHYHMTPFFEAYYPPFEAILAQEWPNLAELNAATVRWLMACWNIRTPVVSSSTWSDVANEPTARLVDICRRVNADTYLSGAGGRGYLDEVAFERAGLRLSYQEFHPSEYPQHSPRVGNTFVACLSALDALFNVGGGDASGRLLGLTRTARGVGCPV